VGAFAGVSLFGLVGLLLGPLAISYFFELVRLYELEYGHGAEPPVVGSEMAHLDAAPSVPVAKVDGG
jgi:predicted PurR-regulated permease PerM